MTFLDALMWYLLISISAGGLIGWAAFRWNRRIAPTIAEAIDLAERKEDWCGSMDAPPMRGPQAWRGKGAR